MARYDGAPGRTRTQRVQFTCPCGEIVVAQIHRGVDASTDPELAQRLLSDDPNRALNLVLCPKGDGPQRAAVPVVYHDPDNETLVLVLPPSLRHRELAERAALLAEMADDTSVPVPAYARDFAVAFGAGGLRAHLEAAASRAVDRQRQNDARAEVDRLRSELEARASALADERATIDRLTGKLDQTRRELEDRSRQLAEREAELDRRAGELDRRLAEVEVRQQELERAEKASVPRGKPSAGDGAGATVPFEMIDASDLGRGVPVETHSENTESLDAELEPMPLEEGEVIVADQLVQDGAKAARPARVGQDGETRVGGAGDVAIERWIVSGDKSLKLVDDDGQVRLAVCADGAELEHLLGERLGMKLQLHRLPTYPLVTLTFGTPAMVRGDLEDGRPVVFFFDIRDSGDRAVLEALGREFTFRFELYDNEHLPVRKRTVSCELAENVAYLLSTADAHADSIAASERSFDRAIIAYDDPSYDRLGAEHPERREFREDKLSRLGAVSEVRRALAIARRFSAPEREAYLVLIRGYPLATWRERRLAVLNRAIALGLWIGTTLSQIAVSEGLARSRKDLVARLRANFAHTIADGDCDLDDEAVTDNWNSLESESEKLGLAGRSSGAASSEDAPFASGTIGTGSGARPTLAASPAARRTVDQLIGQLEDDMRRLEAAVELARRGEERAIGPVFNSLRRMTRGEAVRVLGFSVGFGPRATPHLVDGLRSRKSYLRQGCALALAVLGTEVGVEAICDQLVAEPTEIWQEIARGLGKVGPSAVMSLAARLAGQGERGRERVAWALAHIAAAGGEPPVRALAGGRDAVAGAVARRALGLVDQARQETAQVLGADDPGEQTVNRAFSRSFFEAAQSVRPGAAPALVRDVADLSGPAMLLDESDLLEAPELDDAEPLDESDLIPT